MSLRSRSSLLHSALALAFIVSTTPVLFAQSQTIVSDTFTGTNGTVLSAHAPNVTLLGGGWATAGRTATLNNGHVGLDGTYGGASTAMVDAGVANGTISASISSGTSGAWGGLIFRATDTNNYWIAVVGDPACAVIKVVNGTWTTAAYYRYADEASPSLSTNLAVNLSGSSIQFLCGNFTLQATDAFNVTATKHGLQWYWDGLTTYDNFSVVGTPPPVPAVVTVTPAAPSIAFNGTTTLTAQAYSSTNQVLSGVTYGWQSSNPSVLAITGTSGNTATATVTGMATGSATITATPTYGASGSATVTVGPGTYLIYDAFSGTDNSVVTAHAPNVNQLGASWTTTGPVTPVLHGQQLGVGSGTGAADAFIDAGAPDAIVQVIWTPGANPSAGANYSGLIFRRSDANNYFLFQYWNGSVSLSRTAAGVYTQLWTTTVSDPFGAPRALTVTLSGNSIQVAWAAGAAGTTITDSFNVAATQYGVRMSSGDAASTYDNFQVVGTLPPAPTLVTITPASPAIAFGASTTLTAHAYDAANNALTGVSYTWQSSNSTVASVTALTATTGSVSGNATGSAVITATPTRGVSGNTTVSIAPGGYLVYDRFSDVDGTLVTAHTPNVNQLGGSWITTGPVTPVLRGQQLGVGSGTGPADAVIDAASPNVTVGVIWTPGVNPANGNYSGLIFRRSSANNYFVLQYWKGWVSLWRVANGQYTNLWADTVDDPAGGVHALSAITSGSNIQVAWDSGVKLANVVDGFNVTASQYGVRMSSGDAASTYDNFSVAGTLPPAIPLLATSVPTLTLAPFDTATLSAQATDSLGTSVVGALVQWQTSNESIATVSTTSSTSVDVTAVAEGSATITAHAPVGPAPDVTIPVTVRICIGVLPASSVSLDYTAGSWSMAVTAPTDCTWTARSTVPWITVTGGTLGSGGRTIGYSVNQNDGSTRAGGIIVGGRVFTVVQPARPCTYTVWPLSATFAGDGGSGTFDVFTTGGCSWSVHVTQATGFLTASADGVGHGTISYTVASNIYASNRGETIQVGDAIFTVNQLDNSTMGGNLSPDPGPYVGSPDSRSDTLTAGWQLTQLTSNDGRFTLSYQADGNLVLRQGASLRWAAGTNGVGYALMQGDGNLVAYTSAGTVQWQSGTWGHDGSFLRLENNGQAVIYSPTGAPLWTAGTNDGSPSSEGVASGPTTSDLGPPGDATPISGVENALSFVDAIDAGVHVAPQTWATFAAPIVMPSCLLYAVQGNIGYIITQVGPTIPGSLQWKVGMYNVQDELGPWWVDVLVNGVLRTHMGPEQGYFLYGPHGSLPAQFAPSGSIAEIYSAHIYFAIIPSLVWGGPERGWYLSWIKGVRQATGALACRMP
jgi:uncharacterized protein YjdB